MQDRLHRAVRTGKSPESQWLNPWKVYFPIRDSVESSIHNYNTWNMGLSGSLEQARKENRRVSKSDLGGLTLLFDPINQSPSQVTPVSALIAGTHTCLPPQEDENEAGFGSHITCSPTEIILAGLDMNWQSLLTKVTLFQDKLSRAGLSD